MRYAVMPDPTKNTYPQLSQLIMGYLNQDMDMIAASVPGAIAVFAKDATPAEHDALRAEIAAFRVAHPADADAVFNKLYGFDFAPSEAGQTTGEFFDMLLAILANPTDLRRFEDQ
jgi:CdiI immunity protein